MNITCFDDIIGLSEGGCLDCLDVADQGTESLSGLYLDTLEQLAAVDEIKVCKDQTLWQVMANARNEGIRRFMGDANGMLASRYKWKRENWSGNLGRYTSTGTYEKGAGNYAGIRIKPAPVAGGVLRIKAVNTLFKESGTISLKVYNSRNQLLSTNTLNVSAGYTVNTLVTPIELPLYDNLLGSDLEYFFVYESTKEASLNEAYCTCGGFNVTYNCDQPYYGMTAKSMENRWSQWLMVGGWEGTSLTAFDDVPVTAGAYAYGLVLDVDIFCNSSEVICKDEIKFDGSNVLAYSIAYAILYASADYLAMRLLSSTKLTRTVMTNRETMLQARKEWEGKYIEHISYVVDNLDLSRNDCLTCQQEITTGIGKIFA